MNEEMKMPILQGVKDFFNRQYRQYSQPSRPIGTILYHLLYIFLGSYIFFYLIGNPVFSDPDVSWIIYTGKQIRTLGHIPKFDNFSFSTENANYPMVQMPWLWFITMSWLHDLVGLQNLFYVGLVIYGLVLTLLAYVLIKRGCAYHCTYAAVFINLMVLGHFSPFRAEVVTYVFSLLFLYFLNKARKDKRYYYPLPFINALWSNLHWGVFVSFIIIAAFGAEALIEKNYQRIKQLTLVGSCCFIAILVNPYGYNLLPALFHHLSSNLGSNISEWEPLSFGLYYGADLLFIVLFTTSNYKNKNIPIADKILTLFCFFSSISAIRNCLLLAGLGAYFIARNLEAYEPKDVGQKYENKSIRPRDFIIACSTIALSLLLPLNLIIQGATAYGHSKDFHLTRASLHDQAWNWNLLKKFANDRDLLVRNNNVPYDAIQFILKNYKDKRLLNYHGYGGYITYYSDNRIKTFIDGRNITAYPPEVWKGIVDLHINKSNDEVLLNAIVKKYKIDGIFIPNAQASIFPGLEKNWRMVYRDEIASIYLLKSKK